ARHEIHVANKRTVGPGSGRCKGPLRGRVAGHRTGNSEAAFATGYDDAELAVESGLGRKPGRWERREPFRRPHRRLGLVSDSHAGNSLTARAVHHPTCNRHAAW